MNENQELEEIQLNEIEALKAIYMDDFEFYHEKTAWKIKPKIPEFLITIRSENFEQRDIVKVKMHFKFSKKYPNTSPQISVKENHGIRKEQMQKALEIIERELIPERLGTEMIFDITNWTQEYITKHNVAKEIEAESFYEAMVKRQEKDKEIELEKRVERLKSRGIKISSKGELEEVDLVQAESEILQMIEEEDKYDKNELRTKIQQEMERLQQAVIKGEERKKKLREVSKAVRRTVGKITQKMKVLKLERKIKIGCNRGKGGDIEVEEILLEEEKTNRVYKQWKACVINKNEESVTNHKLTVMEFTIDGSHYEMETGARQLARAIADIEKLKQVRSENIVSVYGVVLEAVSSLAKQKIPLINTILLNLLNVEDGEYRVEGKGYEKQSIDGAWYLGDSLEEDEEEEEEGESIEGVGRGGGEIKERGYKSEKESVKGDRGKRGWKLYILTEEQQAPEVICLREIVNMSGGLSLEKVKEYGKELVQALASLHEQGLTHRSIILENVLLKKRDYADVGRDKELSAVLTGALYFEHMFSLHKMAKLNTKWTDSIEMTMRVAPEVVERADQLSRWQNDVYCLGLVLVQMVLGTQTFKTSRLGSEYESEAVVGLVNMGKRSKKVRDKRGGGKGSKGSKGDGEFSENVDIQFCKDAKLRVYFGQLIQKMVCREQNKRPKAKDILKERFFIDFDEQSMQRSGTEEEESEEEEETGDTESGSESDSEFESGSKSESESESESDSGEFGGKKKVQAMKRGKGLYRYNSKDIVLQNKRGAEAKRVKDKKKKALPRSYGVKSKSLRAKLGQTSRNRRITNGGDKVKGERHSQAEYSDEDEYISSDGEDGVMESTRSLNSSRYKNDFDEMGFVGKGGFGSVVKARNKIDGRLYAIKKVGLDSKDLKSHNKIIREAVNLSRLHHPNVVRYFNTWVERGLVESHISEEDDDYSEDEDDEESDEDSEEESEYDSEQESSEPRLELQETSSNVVFFGTESSNEESSDVESSYKMTGSDRISSSTQPTAAKAMVKNTKVTKKPHMILIETQEVSKKRTAASKEKRGETLYIQMEYCENKTLRDLISEGIEERTGWRLFRQMLEALKHIHQCGMIHRDLKPVNVFLDANGDVKIGDFGLSTSSFASIEEVTQRIGVSSSNLSGGGSSSHLGSGMLSAYSQGGFEKSIDYTLTTDIGTLTYVAPEVLNQVASAASGSGRGRYNYKVDMYSLGIIFFEMCHPLRTGMERALVIHGLRKPEIVIPDTFPMDAMPNQLKIIRQLLTHNVQERPSSVELLESELMPSKLEDEDVEDMMRAICNPEHRYYEAIMKMLFQRRPNVQTDALYDYQSSFGVIEKLNIVFAERVKEKMMNVFKRHGGIEIKTPLIVPKNEMIQGVRRGSAVQQQSAVDYIDVQGNAVQLRYDLTLPMARYIVKNKITGMKRYGFEQVYWTKNEGGGSNGSGTVGDGKNGGKLENGMVGVAGQPMAVNMAGFDIVTNEQMHAVATGEIMLIISEIIDCYPMFSEGKTVVVLNHTDILDAILNYVGICITPTNTKNKNTKNADENTGKAPNGNASNTDTVYVTSRQLQMIYNHMYNILGPIPQSSMLGGGAKKKLQSMKLGGDQVVFTSKVIERLIPFLDLRGNVVRVQNRVLSILYSQQDEQLKSGSGGCGLDVSKRKERLISAFTQLSKLEAAKGTFGIDEKVEFVISPLFSTRNSKTYYEHNYYFQVLYYSGEIQQGQSQLKSQEGQGILAAKGKGKGKGRWSKIGMGMGARGSATKGAKTGLVLPLTSTSTSTSTSTPAPAPISPVLLGQIPVVVAEGGRYDALLHQYSYIIGDDDLMDKTTKRNKKQQRNGPEYGYRYGGSIDNLYRNQENMLRRYDGTGFGFGFGSGCSPGPGSAFGSNVGSNVNSSQDILASRLMLETAATSSSNTSGGGHKTKSSTAVVGLNIYFDVIVRELAIYLGELNHYYKQNTSRNASLGTTQNNIKVNKGKGKGKKITKENVNIRNEKDENDNMCQNRDQLDNACWYTQRYDVMIISSNKNTHMLSKDKKSGDSNILLKQRIELATKLWKLNIKTKIFTLSSPNESFERIKQQCINAGIKYLIEIIDEKSHYHSQHSHEHYDSYGRNSGRGINGGHANGVSDGNSNYNSSQSNFESDFVYILYDLVENSQQYLLYDKLIALIH